MRSEELKPGFCGRAQMMGAEKRNLELGIPAGNGASREMGHLEDLGLIVLGLVAGRDEN